MPNLSKKEYLVQCNENLSTEPFKIFDLFKFKIKFNSNERKSFVIVIDLGGKMKQFENWDKWLKELKTEFKIDTQKMEEGRNLFGVKLPFLSKVISQELEVKEHDVSVDNELGLIVADEEEVPSLPQDVNAHNGQN